jgi:hypothetical protein
LHRSDQPLLLHRHEAEQGQVAGAYDQHGTRDHEGQQVLADRRPDRRGRRGGSTERNEGLRKENWSLRGPNQILKVLPYGSAATALSGYITVGMSLLGKTPQQIEQALGLKARYLANGAKVYRFTRLPMVHEYEYELTAFHPGGLAFNPAHSDPRYPPGSSKVQQWRIKDNVLIPVDSKNFLDLKFGQRFPYGWLQ